MKQGFFVVSPLGKCVTWGRKREDRSSIGGFPSVDHLLRYGLGIYMLNLFINFLSPVSYSDIVL